MDITSKFGRKYFSSKMSERQLNKIEEIRKVALKITHQHDKFLALQENKELLSKLTRAKIHPEKSYLIIGTREQLKYVPVFLIYSSVHLEAGRDDLANYHDLVFYKLAEFCHYLSHRKNIKNNNNYAEEAEEREKFEDADNESLILYHSKQGIDNGDYGEWLVKVLLEEVADRDINGNRTVILSEKPFFALENSGEFEIVRLDDKNGQKVEVINADEFDE